MKDRDEGHAPLPTISLVTPSYNQARFLETALRSVVEQDYPWLEYIVLDGGSTDGSVEILERFDGVIDHWKSEPDDGQADAINRGWQLADGQVLGWLNSDDRLEPGALDAVGETFARRPGTRLVYGDCRVVDAQGRQIRDKRPEGYDVRTLLMGASLPQPSVFMHRSLVEELGGLDVSLHHALDWAFFLRAFVRCSSDQLRYLPRYLSASRVYEGTKTRTGLSAKGRERRQALAELRASGELAEFSSAAYRRAMAGTYRVQAVDEWLAGRSLDAAVSAVRALLRDPIGALEKVSSMVWLVSERRRRRKEEKMQ